MWMSLPWNLASTAKMMINKKQNKRQATCLCAAGFILIGFFIRNLVKRTLKTGDQCKKRKKMHHQLYIKLRTHTHIRSTVQSRKFALQFFFVVRVLFSALLFIQYYFQKGCRCIKRFTTLTLVANKKKNKFVSAHIIKHRFRFRFAWYRNVMSYIYINIYTYK